MNLMNLDHPVYTQLNKVRGQTNTPDIFGIHDPVKAGKIIMKAFPDLSPIMIEALRDMHDLLAEYNNALWVRVVNSAAFDTWGRPYVISDYKVSGIASDEFSVIFKDMLRDAAHKKNKHNTLARIYGHLALKNKAKK